jgi:hypothetical protein
MYEEQDRTSFIVGFFRSYATVFTLSILVTLLMGLLISRFFPGTQEISSLFALKGFSYNSILELAGYSFFLAVFMELLMSYRLLIKMRFFSRLLVFFLAVLFTSSIFSVIFKWFPADNLTSWVGFLIAFIICFALSFVLTTLVFRTKNKKYNKLLEAYKERSKINMPGNN